MDVPCLNSLTIWENPLFANILLTIILIVLIIKVMMDYWKSSTENYKSLGLSQLKLMKPYYIHSRNHGHRVDNKESKNKHISHKMYITDDDKGFSNIEEPNQNMVKEMRRITNRKHLSEWDSYNCD